VFRLRTQDAELIVVMREVLAVNDEFDVAVHDVEALAEIELLTNLIIATSEHEGHLPEQRIDEILGVAGSDIDGSGDLS
jgi:hypothetical protein